MVHILTSKAHISLKKKRRRLVENTILSKLKWLRDCILSMSMKIEKEAPTLKVTCDILLPILKETTCDLEEMASK